METLNIISGIKITDKGAIAGKYVVTDYDKKYVKQVRPSNSIEDFNEPDLDGLDDESAEANTKILAESLRIAGLTPVVKRMKYASGNYTVVRCKGFEMYYHSHGFRIFDMDAYKAPINMNEYNNDFGSVDTVIHFLQNPPIASPAPKPENPENKEKAETVEKLSKKFKVTVTPEPKALAEKVELTPADMKAVLLQVFNDYKEKVIATSTDLKNALYDLVPKKYRKFKIQVGKIAETCTRRNLEKRLNEFEKMYDGFDFEESIAEVAPKFISGDMPTEFERVELYQEEGRTFMIFETEGKSFQMPRHIFYARLALTIEPKAMQYVMKVVRGEVTLQEAYTHYFEDASFIIKDKTIGYSLKELTKTTHTAAVEEVAKLIMSAYETVDPAKVVYKGTSMYVMNEDEITIGKKVRIYWADMNAWYLGTVTSIKNGVQIRYEDGSIAPLLINQKITKH